MGGDGGGGDGGGGDGRDGGGSRGGKFGGGEPDGGTGIGSVLKKSSGRFATRSASVIRSSICGSKSIDSTRLKRLLTKERSSSAMLVMSVRMRVAEESGPRTKRTVTLPDGSLLLKTLNGFLLLSAKPSRRAGCENALEHFDEHSDERLENLPKSRKCFGTPRPSPRGVACLEVVLPPAMVCFTKDKSLWKPRIWIITCMLFFRFLEVITPRKETELSLSKIRGFTCFHIFNVILSSGLGVLRYQDIYPKYSG